MVSVPSSSSLSEWSGAILAGDPTAPRGVTGGQQGVAKDSKSRAAACDSKMRQKVQFAQQVRVFTWKLYYTLVLHAR